jgi:hypothetical protein
MQQAYCLLVLCLLIAGCSSPKTIALPDAVYGLEADLKKIGWVSFSDLISKRESSTRFVDEYIRKKQCFYGNANPLIPFVLKDLRLTLKGSFSLDGKFQVQASAPSPELGFSLGSTKGSEQTVEATISLLSLEVLPTIYMETEVMGIVATMSEDQKKEAFATIADNKRTMEERVKALIESFDSAQHCSKMISNNKDSRRRLPSAVDQHQDFGLVTAFGHFEPIGPFLHMVDWKSNHRVPICRIITSSGPPTTALGSSK